MIDGHRVLDAHVHMQPWSMLRPEVRAVMEKGRDDVEQQLRYQSDRASFEAFLEREGIDAAVCVNYVAPDVMGFTQEVNDWIGAYTKGSERLLPMGSVHPRLVKDPAAEVERLARDLGIRALKVHPSHQLLHPHGYTQDLPGLADVYEAAQRLRLPVTVHTGTSIFPGARNRYADPLFVDDVAVDYPDLPILLAHVGRPFWMEKAVFLARRHENVHLEISGIPPKKLLEYVPRLPDLAHKVVWGSDWPSPGVRSLSKNVRDFLALPGLSDADKGRILWDNGAALYGL